MEIYATLRMKALMSREDKEPLNLANQIKEHQVDHFGVQIQFVIWVQTPRCFCLKHNNNMFLPFLWTRKNRT